MLRCVLTKYMASCLQSCGKRSGILSFMMSCLYLMEPEFFSLQTGSQCTGDESVSLASN